jgi:DNA-binding response OmpR family regulator
MSEGLDRIHPSAGATAGADGAKQPHGGARAPVCYILDDEPSIRHFLSLILHGAGVDAEEFSDGATFRAAVAKSSPDLVFLDIGLESAATIESVIALGKRGYSGFVQLMSSR